MKFYIYWYFAFYIIYERFSKDTHFDAPATALFSLFSTQLIAGVIGILMHFLGMQFFFLKDAMSLVIFGFIVYIFNIVLFIPKERKKRLFDIYRNLRSVSMDVFMIILSIISVALFVFAVRTIK